MKKRLGMAHFSKKLAFSQYLDQKSFDVPI